MTNPVLWHSAMDSDGQHSPIEFFIEPAPNGLIIQIGHSDDSIVLDYATTLRILLCRDDGTDEAYLLGEFRVINDPKQNGGESK